MALPQIPADKASHLLYGYAAAAFACLAAWWWGLRAPAQLMAAALVGALCVGLLKEAYDAARISRAEAAGLSPTDRVEFADAAATVIGGLMFCAPVWLLRMLLRWVAP
jgi:hypothetical protein